MIAFLFGLSGAGVVSETVAADTASAAVTEEICFRLEREERNASKKPVFVNFASIARPNEWKMGERKRGAVNLKDYFSPNEDQWPRLRPLMNNPG